MDAQVSQQDLSWLEKFKAEALKFRDAYTALTSQQAYVQQRPALKAEYDALYSRGSMIRSTVEAITRTVDQVTGFFSEAFAQTSGAFKRFFGLGLAPPRNLGVLPLIPIAAIAGAVAMMGKWVSDVYLFERKVGEQQRLEARGLSPADAAALVASGSGAGGGGFLGDVLGDLKTPLLVGGAAWLFFTVIWPAMQSRRGS